MKRICAVAVILLVALLSGCATTVKVLSDISPDRPYPPQPSVTVEIASRLASKNPKEFPVYLSPVVRYRDTSSFVKGVAEVLKAGKGEVGIQISTFPITFDPPKATVENATQFMGDLKNKLDQAGFRRVNEPCEECLNLIVDYADAPVGSAMICLFSLRVFYIGNEVMIARGRFVSWSSSWIRDKAIAFAAQRATEELLQVWNWRVAGWRQKMSAIEPTQQLSAVGK